MSTFSDQLSIIELASTPPPPSPKYNSKLLPVDYTNDVKLNEELTEIASLSGNDIIKHNGKFYKASKYRDALNITLGKITTDEIDPRQLSYEDVLDIASIPLSKDVKDDVDVTDLASLEAILVDAKKNIELIDNYILGLVTGRDFTEFSLSRSENKFIKLAEDTAEEENKEVVRNYFNELYDHDPNYGNVMTEPEDYRDKLTTEADSYSKPVRFKKV
jgi:hypothetical protein